jgi:hypothetical protein
LVPGSAPAAVQYFYPDEASLYTATIEQMTAHMDGVYARISGQPDAGVPPLAAFLRFLPFDDILDRTIAGFFYALRSLANREPIAARVLAARYEQQLFRLVALVMTIGYGKQGPPACAEPARTGPSASCWASPSTAEHWPPGCIPHRLRRSP